MAKRGGKVAVATFRARISRAIPVNAIVNCADNSGVLQAKVIGVFALNTRKRRIPTAAVGDMVKVSVYKGKTELKDQLLNAVVIRQRKPYRRPDGSWIAFEDNAVVILTPEGDVKGTEIYGPVAKEAAERWPKIAAIASLVV
ncbi:MAG: 50S ribosomal protein L14 [Thermoproteota archaeon]|jgi:large subunit ribosomal protein L14|nr:50S ribosomal protein L14 [Thermoproteota archaeon]